MIDNKVRQSLSARLHGSVVNRVLPSLHGGPLEITLRDPLTIVRFKTDLHFFSLRHVLLKTKAEKEHV